MIDWLYDVGDFWLGYIFGVVCVWSGFLFALKFAKK